MAKTNITMEIIQKRIKDDCLDLSSLRLTQIPFNLILQCIKTAGPITKIDLSNNLLTSMPPQLCLYFAELEELNLAHNKIKRLPENIGRMVYLRKLNLSYNQIKILPYSFADLEELEWLNLNKNPLEQDLAEVIGDCSNDAKCAHAASSAVQYVHFSATLSSESTAIADIGHILESSSLDEDSQKYPPQKNDLERREKYKRTDTPRTIDQSNQPYFGSGTIFVLILLLLTILGIPLWLTLDSIRASCVNEDFYFSLTEERKLCNHINEILTNGTFPKSFTSFLGDFYSTFKHHWSLAINKIKPTDSWKEDAKIWSQMIFSNVKMASFKLMEILEPILSLFVDYLFDLWNIYIFPLIKEWI